MARACLVDVYDTILTTDFKQRIEAEASFAGADPGAWSAEWTRSIDERSRGELSIAGAMARTLRACGIGPRPGLADQLARMDTELLVATTRVYDDTAAFFGILRAEGIRTALVSNCSQNTRHMLGQRAVLSLADSVILSCEVGSVKPSPEIYLRALSDLGIAPADAVMVDDHASFCAGAQAVGVRAIQIARPDLGKPPHPSSATPVFPVVGSLLEVPPLL